MKNSNYLIRSNGLGEIAVVLKKNKRVINVYGEGGVGKTTALRTIVESHVEETTEREVKNVIKEQGFTNIYYTEVSACVSDYEIYYNLVNAIEKKSNIKFTKFHIIYNWYLEERKRGFQKAKKDVKKDVYELLAQAVGISIKDLYTSLEEFQEQKEQKSTILVALENIEMIRIFLESGVGLVNLILSINSLINKRKNNKILDDLLELTEGCTSDLDYRKILRKCLIDEWKEQNIQDKTIFIIDNYRIRYSVELNSNSAWLKELTEGMGQYWIIGSRIEIQNQWGDCYEAINMAGFDEKQAKKYVEKSIDWEKFHENSRRENNLSREELKAKILSVCKNKEKYLPYQLNLVVNYVKERILEKEEISSEDIVEYTKDKFVDYYYFSHMSEMVVAAVQLLSCLPAWNAETYNLLKNKFNYHYLEAEYLMHQCAFVEYKDDVIKLHEAIRDAVFASENNYIIRDVSKYLYRELTDKILDKQAGNLIVDYFDITKAYLSSLTNNKSLYSAEVKNFKKVLEELYKIYKKEENTTLEFAEAYRGILAFVYGKDSKECIEKELECADLYTKLYMPKTACEIEEECLNRLEEEKFSEEYILRVQAYNWASFDNSKKWDYQKAYTLGIDGLKYAHSVVRKLVEEIGLSEETEVVEALKRILRVYNDEMDLVDQKDMLHGMHNREKETLSVETFEEDFLFVKGKWLEKKDKKKKEQEQKEEKQKEQDSKEERDKLGDVINLLENQYNKFRGNFPWYCIKVSEIENINPEIDVVDFGINTYYIRKCIFKVNKKLGLTKGYESLMLKSLQNIAIYMFKQNMEREGKWIDNAILILEEAIRKRSYNMPVVNENENIIRTKRKLEILNNAVENVSFSGKEGMSRREITDKMCEHCKNLYDRFNFSKNIWNLYYKDVIEPYSYLGDLYIAKKWYYEGLEKLAFVLMQNYVNQQIFTAETMDAYCRASIALCGLKEIDLAKDFMVVVCEISNDSEIQCPKSKQEEYIRVKEKIEKLNLVEKDEIKDVMVDEIYAELK